MTAQTIADDEGRQKRPAPGQRLVAPIYDLCSLRIALQKSPEESKMWPSQRPFQPTVQHLHRTAGCFRPITCTIAGSIIYIHSDTELEP